jgi:hypothetical protein
MPDVLGAPRWARSGENENSPPADREAYGHYLAAAIRRYGPHGTFWKAHPELPKMGIRDWQIWNEPCLRYWWHVPKGSDWAKSYAKLLKVAYAAAKKADGDVRIVLGGLVGKSWQQLEHLYEVGHVRGHFDMAAVHPYTAASHGPLKIVERFRKAMRRHGDGKRPLVISETTLPASRGRANGDAAFQTDDAGMASFLKATYRDFTKNRNKLRIARVYWYTWSSSYQSSDPFAYAGLVRYRRKDDGEHIREMPALSVYRKLALRAEGCRKDREGRCAGPPP